MPPSRTSASLVLFPCSRWPLGSSNKGQFISTCTGISNADTVMARLAGDEGETVSLTPWTLTVDECFTTYTK
jgi:hypothetical protein